MGIGSTKISPKARMLMAKAKGDAKVTVSIELGAPAALEDLRSLLAANGGSVDVYVPQTHNATITLPVALIEAVADLRCVNYVELNARFANPESGKSFEAGVTGSGGIPTAKD